ncbi:MAG: hypothetical protein PSV35_06195, partial [bacterium]|nr:hypothetical protein [bacterium]
MSSQTEPQQYNNLELSLLITDIKKELKKLPYNEFTYYISLLIASIQNEGAPEKHIILLNHTQQLINKIHFFYTNPEQTQHNIVAVTEAINNLINISNMHSPSQKRKHLLMNICGAAISLLLGLSFGLIGLTIGLLTDSNIIGNIKGAGLGFVAGFAVGSLVGYRIPTKLLQQPIHTKVEFCVNNLSRLRDELKDRKTHEEYQQDTKKYILDTFFSTVPSEQKENAFATFLKEEQAFQVCTTSAGHISNSLKGYLGHHSLIRFKINGIKDIPIEFGERRKTPNHVDQSEKPRIVIGHTLFAMLVLDRILQDTHSSNITKALRIYDVGNDDCRTYIDKILIGTGQEPTKISRFSDKNDTYIGRKIVAPLIGFFNK